MRIIFCSEPFSPYCVDSIYEKEAQTAQSIGFEYDLINFEELVNAKKPNTSVRLVKEQSSVTTAIYRGWMLKPEEYKQLFNALTKRNIYLINSPAQYKHCHYLPESYFLIKNHTPSTVFFELNSNFNLEDIFPNLSIFGDKPLVVKDYVKSRKHEWQEACFIPSASDYDAVKRVVNRFIELQGDDINKGLVFREFVEFQPLTAHTKSKMPLTKEFRLFFLDGELLDSFEYWDEGEYADSQPPTNIFADVARSIQSRFFTMDIAQTISGEWQIVELGDGQVAGFPENADISRFYQALKNRLAEK